MSEELQKLLYKMFLLRVINKNFLYNEKKTFLYSKWINSKDKSLKKWKSVLCVHFCMGQNSDKPPYILNTSTKTMASRLINRYKKKSLNNCQAWTNHCFLKLQPLTSKIKELKSIFFFKGGGGALQLKIWIIMSSNRKWINLKIEHC